MMNKYILGVLLVIFALPALAQNSQSQAKGILDKTAEVIRKSGVIKAEFTAKSFNNKVLEGESQGTIHLKGDKFVVKTPEVTTWFDGKTQWSYMKGSEEVNVSNPTPEELQMINPYALLSIYQKGFSCKLGPVKSFRGNAVYEIVLTNNNRKQDLSCIIMYVLKDTYQPLFVLLQQRNVKLRSEIMINNYQSNVSISDAAFTFDRKQYPNAEIIDLR